MEHDSELSKSCVPNNECARFHGSWEQLPFLSEASMPVLRAVSRRHVIFVEESVYNSDQDAAPPEGSKIVKVVFQGSDSLCMDDVFEVLLPFGDIELVDWTDTPEGKEMTVLQFKNEVDARRACKAEVQQIRNKRGRLIDVKVFR